MKAISCPEPKSILTSEPKDSRKYLNSSTFALLISFGKKLYKKLSHFSTALASQSLKATLPNLYFEGYKGT